MILTFIILLALLLALLLGALTYVRKPFVVRDKPRELIPLVPAKTRREFPGVWGK